ncbi:MAG: AmmeMemoRadiSam system protein A [Desulfobulbaceae bacterium]|nr:AmmeMemoRadiSam system protein A [Desulfobulbaceae bacterium]
MTKQEELQLNARQMQALLAFARNEIALVLQAPDAATSANPVLAEPVFQRKQAAFVTLRKNGTLRGCIGSLSAVESLLDSVRHNAVNAALHDPRFPPLTLQELEQVQIEISVLGIPQPLPYTDVTDLLHQLEPGKDGLILEGPGKARATFLPQVWQQLPQPSRFLSELCRKAGLATDSWQKNTLSFQRYRVQSLSESRG